MLLDISCYCIYIFLFIYCFKYFSAATRRIWYLVWKAPDLILSTQLPECSCGLSAGRLTQTTAVAWIRIPGTAPVTFGVIGGILTSMTRQSSTPCRWTRVGFDAGSVEQWTVSVLKLWSRWDYCIWDHWALWCSSSGWFGRGRNQPANIIGVGWLRWSSEWDCAKNLPR